MLEEKIQLAAIEIFKNLGYEEVEVEKLKSFENGIQTDILEKQIEKINQYEYNGKIHKFKKETIKQVIENLQMNITYFSNEDMYDLLTLGTSCEEIMEDGSKKTCDIKYIDFENINNNFFHIVKNYSIIDKKYMKFRSDIVIFINGIPIAILELKMQNLENGIDKMVEIQKKFPEFFKFIQLIMVFNEKEAKYATSMSEKEQFTTWKEQDESFIGEKIRLEVSEQYKIIASLFLKERLLDLIKNYILYNEDKKTISRSQQYFTVKAILERTNKIDEKGKRKGGIICHASGAGKTITMVYTIKKLLEKYPFEDTKIVIVTDRKELEEQIEQIFTKVGMKIENATTGLNLIELIENKNIRVINTIINKFETAIKYNIQVESENVFILIDEASRAQNGSLSNNMKLIFKNATYLFFTSIPIIEKQKFGDLITPIYNPYELTKDNLTVPLIYEKRGYIKENEQYIHTIIESEQRIHKVAENINNHYKNYLQKTGFNAILACDTVTQAIKYYKELKKIGELKIGIIIQQLERNIEYEENDEIRDFCYNLLKEYKNERRYEEIIKEKFIKGEIDIIIVVNKLLTGLDAPKVATLYIDKKLEGATLIQAIGRINRVCKGKDFAYIVDYRGIEKELDKYSNLGFKYVFYSINTQIEIMQKAYKELKELFKNKQEMEEFEILLEDNNIRRKFYKEFKTFANLLGNILPNSEACSKLENIENYKKHLLLYQTLRRNIQIRYAQDIDNKEYEPKLQKTIDKYLNTNGTLKMKEYCDITNKEEFEKEYKIMKTTRAKADLIKSKLLRIMKEENKTYYNKFLEKIETVAIEYKTNKITDIQYLKEMQKIKESFLTGSSKKITGINIKDKEIKAIFNTIYNSISNNLEELNINEIEKVAINIKNEIQSRIKKDWQQNKQIKNSIKQMIDEQIYYYTKREKIETSFEKIDEIIETILNIAMLNFII